MANSNTKYRNAKNFGYISHLSPEKNRERRCRNSAHASYVAFWEIHAESTREKKKSDEIYLSVRQHHARSAILAQISLSSSSFFSSCCCRVDCDTVVVSSPPFRVLSGRPDVNPNLNRNDFATLSCPLAWKKHSRVPRMQNTVAERIAQDSWKSCTRSYSTIRST